MVDQRQWWPLTRGARLHLINPFPCCASLSNSAKLKIQSQHPLTVSDDMQHRLVFWFPCDSSCLRPLSERLRCFACTLLYDLRGVLSNMRAVRLCQLLKDITINPIFSKRSATVQQGACERQGA